MDNNQPKPEILAPAGDVDCFLAALAAGADAVYLGLKHFSARMEAENFTFSQLYSMTELAHANRCRIYVALNTLLKPDELAEAWQTLVRLTRQVPVDGIIIQDLAFLACARQAGFKKNVAFSTLANVSFPAALAQVSQMGATRVIVPRELSLDEMKLMGESCPPQLTLECFVHGALCYCVSGRCYWSSYMGGKSGLRGRCVQPCRRNYLQSGTKVERKRLFACQDLELGVLVKTLLQIPELDSWKIEGRKKGPHYVFHTVTAYRLLRDHPGDAGIKKMALGILELALGRPGVKANFLSQRPVQPMQPDRPTSSGLLIGRVSFAGSGTCRLRPRLPLLAQDYLRIGVEDEPWHATISIKRAVPKGGTLTLNLPGRKKPKAGTPVFLIDRREPALQDILAAWRQKLLAIQAPVLPEIQGAPILQKRKKKIPLPDMIVQRWPQGDMSYPRRPPGKCVHAFWLSASCLDLPEKIVRSCAFWLPPDLWPDNQSRTERLLKTLLQKGSRFFVCNSPWQKALFDAPAQNKLILVAGPFCNISNALAIEELERSGFAGVFASQELSGQDLTTLASQSSLTLGLGIKGFFPVGVSRFGLAHTDENSYFTSPKNEVFWTARHDESIWLYPGWQLDLTKKRKELEQAGFGFFAFYRETPPGDMPKSSRQGLFNWKSGLL